MESICALIPNDIGTDCGYHRDCYQNFIRNVRRLKRDVCIAGTSKDFQVTRRGASSDKVALFSKDCIFCNKEGHIGVKKSGSWTSEANKKFQSESWQTVVEHAKSKGDEKLLLRIRDVDLFAAEAHFHPSCRKRYVTDPLQNAETKSRLYQDKLEEAHECAFAKVCEKVTNKIIIAKKVLKLTDLLNVYIKVLDDTEFANALYRSEKLKSKLENRFKGDLGFCKPDSYGKFVSQLVYNANMQLDSAIANAYVLGNKEIMTESAQLIRSAILDAFEQSLDLRWPPTCQYIDDSDIIPNVLSDFLRSVFSGIKADSSSQTTRLVIQLDKLYVEL
ncbi:hypothetical protein ACF0H5_008367 [Mactra antiquata]